MAAKKKPPQIVVPNVLDDLIEHLDLANQAIRQLRQAYEDLPEKERPPTFRLWAENYKSGPVNSWITMPAGEMMDAVVDFSTAVSRKASDLFYTEEDLG